MNQGLTYALLIALGLGLVALFWTLHRARGNDFDVSDAFVDPATSRASISRITTAIGALAGTWLVVAMELAGRTNEVVVTAYLAYCCGVYALGKVQPKEGA